MKHTFLIQLFSLTIWFIPLYSDAQQSQVIQPALNSLTDQEKAEGWELLFDGSDPSPKWKGIRDEQFPAKGWAIENGTLVLLRSEEHTSELQSRENLVCRLLLEK